MGRKSGNVSRFLLLPIRCLIFAFVTFDLSAYVIRAYPDLQPHSTSHVLFSSSASTSFANLIMAPDKKIHNALKRSEVHRKSKREKGQAKLKRRLDVSGCPFRGMRGTHIELVADGSGRTRRQRKRKD